MISVTLLGSGGGMPMPGRYLSSMLIGFQSRKILIDCGEGTQVSMRENKTGFKTLDIICITHCHGDHIFGLPGLGRRGIKLCYITDTRPIDTIPSFVNESDLLVCEGTYGDDGNLQKAIENKHMTFPRASELAVRGNVKEIWLTHFSPAMDEPELYFKNATDVFPNTVLGYDGITMDLKFPL